MSKIDLTNLNKIDTDLIMPSTSEENVNLQKQQENKWGSILNNQTFNTLNNNIKLLKNSLVETINTLNNENIIAKNKYINEDNDIVSLGDNTKKLNFLTTQIQVNGVDTEFLTSQNLSNISNIAYKDKENTFTFPLNTNQYKINSNQVISDDNDNINIGNNQRKLNLQSSDGKLYLNGQEFKGSSLNSGNDSNDNSNNKYTIERLYGKDVKIDFKLYSLFNINKEKIDNTTFGIKEIFSDKFSNFKIQSNGGKFGNSKLYQMREYIKDTDEGYVNRNNITFFSPYFNFLNKLLFDIENGNNRSEKTDKLKCIKFNFKVVLGDDTILNENVSLYKVFINDYFKRQYQGVEKTDPIFVMDNFIADKEGWYIPFTIPIRYIKSNNDDNLNGSYLFIKLYYNFKYYDERTYGIIPKEAVENGFFIKFEISRRSKTLNYVENFPLFFNDPKIFNVDSKFITISFNNIEKIYGNDTMYDIEKVQYMN